VPAEPKFYPSFLSLCLLAYGLILMGFPSPDIAWSCCIYSIARKYGCEERRAGPANLFVFGFAVLHKRLEAIAYGDYTQVCFADSVPMML
jgi:hypothetical protein